MNKLALKHALSVLLGETEFSVENCQKKCIFHVTIFYRYHISFAIFDDNPTGNITGKK